MKPYSMDLRQRVIDTCNARQGAKEVAKTFRVSPRMCDVSSSTPVERGDIVPRNGGGAGGRKIDPDRLASWSASSPKRR
jgi:hypothetical protein